MRASLALTLSRLSCLSLAHVTCDCDRVVLCATLAVLPPPYASRLSAPRSVAVCRRAAIYPPMLVVTYAMREVAVILAASGSGAAGSLSTVSFEAEYRKQLDELKTARGHDVAKTAIARMHACCACLVCRFPAKNPFSRRRSFCLLLCCGFAPRLRYFVDAQRPHLRAASSPLGRVRPSPCPLSHSLTLYRSISLCARRPRSCCCPCACCWWPLCGWGDCTGTSG